MYSIPASQSKSYYSIDNFLGVDFTSSPIEVDKKRSPNAVNMINNNGYNETRNGYEIIKKLDSRINGIWNIDIPNEEILLVHAGTKLYKIDSDFKEVEELLNDLNDERSTGIYFSDYLTIFDGKRAIIYGNTENGYKAEYIDEIGYIPTTSVGRDSSGGGTDYEKVNLMSPYRINTFLTEMVETTINGELQNNPQTVFKLDDTNIDSVELVEILTENGNWEVLKSDKYQVDTTTGQVTLSEAPG